MKNGDCVILFLFVILLLPSINAYVTGAATSQETGVSVFVLPAAPILKIISPTATTYNEGDNILFNYQAIIMDSVWYNLDNGVNISLNSSFYFLASVGTHTIYLYGNQSNGTILTDQVTFIVKKVSTGGGGGIVIGPEEKINITFEEQYINVNLKQGETKEVRLLVRNDYYKTTSITLEDQNLENLLISISETSFSLNPGQSKEIIVTFTADENKNPELYLEKLIIKTDNSQKDIYFYVEVESKELLFDIKVDIPKEPRVYEPGENILANIYLFNLGQGEADLNIEYIIKDLEDNVIFGEKQTLIIGTSINLIKTFQLPENIEAGNYIFYVKATYQGKIAIASKGFTVIKPATFEQAIEDTFSRITEAGGNLIENLKDDWDALAIALAIFLGSFIILGIIERALGTDGIYWIIKEKGRYYVGAGKRRKRKVIKYARKHYIASKRHKKGRHLGSKKKRKISKRLLKLER
jgi:hypothetical protein